VPNPIGQVVRIEKRPLNRVEYSRDIRLTHQHHSGSYATFFALIGAIIPVIIIAIIAGFTLFDDLVTATRCEGKKGASLAWFAGIFGAFFVVAAIQ